MLDLLIRNGTIVDSQAKAWPSLCPNPLADTALAGWPQMTIRRGAIVWQDGQVTAAPGHGTLIEQRANGSA